MADPTARYCPVGNGDMTLIKLADDSTILVDCKIRDPNNSDDGEAVFDVKADLLEQLRRENGIPHLDAFILTHPDKDHCLGFELHFYQGDLNDYSENDKDEERIVVDELWFAPRIFAPHEKELCPDARAFKDEAERRKKLHQDKADSRHGAGNRLRCLGYSDNPALAGLEEILTVPGNATRKIAGAERNDFQLFIFAPIKADSDDPEGERNDTSVAFAAELLNGEEVTNRVLFFGDAGCRILERICDQNNENAHLEYDLLQTPHHCSWYTFSEKSHAEDDTASDKVMSLLKKKRIGARVVASSKPVKDEDDDPPSDPAKQRYVSVVGDSNFICTGEYPDEDEPKPLIFTLTANGPRQDDPPKGGQRASAWSSIASTAAKPRKYG